MRARRTQLDLARDYELGSGVARDYAAAGAIDDYECAAGSGDSAACRRLLQAGFQTRGVDLTPAQEAGLVDAMCDVRHEPSACIVQVLRAPQAAMGSNHGAVAVLRAALAEPCDAQHLVRCELPRDPFEFFNQSSSIEASDRAYDGTGCKLGVLDACERLQFAEGPEHAAAVVTLGHACDGGDAGACDAIDKPIDAALLCAAHDYAACARQGCAGDEAAALVAAEHHAESRCEAQQSKRGVVVVPTRVTPSATQPFDSIELHRLGTTTRFEVYAVGAKPVTLVIGSVYAYDAAGTQLSDAHYELRNLELAPGMGTTIDVGGAAGATLEPCISLIEFDDGVAHQARCPQHKAQGARWGDGRDTATVDAGLGDIPLAGQWRGDLAAVLAEPFEATHPGVYIRVDGGRRDVFLAPAEYPPDSRAQLVKEVGPVVELPLVREPTEIAYRLAGIDDLQLSARTLAKIFGKQITSWNDPAIVRDNPGRQLPATAITVIQAGSRTDMHRLTSWLAASAKGVWKLGVTDHAELFAGVQVLRPDDAARAVAQLDGGITFVGPGMSAAYGLQVARLPSARGAYVAPTAATLHAGDYPLATVRSLYIGATASAVARAYATWLLGDGLPIFEQLGYGRPAEAVTQAAIAAIPK